MSKSTEILNDVTKIASKHLGVNQETQIITKSIELKFFRSWSSNLKQEVSLEGASFSLPDPCELLNKTERVCNNTPVVQQVKHIKIL